MARSAELVEAVKAHAVEHYAEGGWDVIVECWTDDQVAERIGRARTVAGALRAFAPLVSVWADRQADAVHAAGPVEPVAPAGPMFTVGRVRCGHCGGRHRTVEAVRVCSTGVEMWPCTWLVDLGRDEDGEPIIQECGAESWHLADGRGYRCAAGHSHVYGEVRAAEGWDYTDDPLEAESLRRNGIDAVGVDGGSI